MVVREKRRGQRAFSRRHTPCGSCQISKPGLSSPSSSPWWRWRRRDDGRLRVTARSQCLAEQSGDTVTGPCPGDGGALDAVLWAQTSLRRSGRLRVVGGDDAVGASRCCRFALPAVVGRDGVMRAKGLRCLPYARLYCKSRKSNNAKNLAKIDL
jgi:hypothetical protein